MINKCKACGKQYRSSIEDDGYCSIDCRMLGKLKTNNSDKKIDNIMNGIAKGVTRK